MSATTAGHCEFLLGCILQPGGADIIDHAQDIGITAESFESHRSQIMFDALAAIRAKGGEPDEMLLLQHLEETNQLDAAGGLEAIFAIQGTVESPLHGKYHARSVRDTQLRRQATRQARLAIEALSDNSIDPVDALAELAKFSETISGETQTGLFDDYSKYWQGYVEPPTPTVGQFAPGKALLYSGAANCFYAQPGIGKTWLSLLIAKEQIEQGHDVLLLDPESSALAIHCRLKALGCDPEKGAKHFHYCNDTSPEKIRQLHRWAATRENLFVTFDGLANSIATSGGEENSIAALQVLQDQIKPFADTGACVLVIDHSGKDQSKGARGHSSKLGYFKGAVYSITVGKAFSKTSDGYLRIRLEKDNEGGTGLYIGQRAAELIVTNSEEGGAQFVLSHPIHEEDTTPGAKVSMTDEEILRAVPVGANRAMRFDQISPALSQTRFVERCREIEEIHVEKRKMSSGQSKLHFWRDPKAHDKAHDIENANTVTL